jgi:two-component system LytT family response regulator
MKKIRCLLVDDEPLAVTLLEKHIGQLDFLEIAGSCSSALKAVEVLKRTEVDLLFLDIRMPAISGIELLKMLRHPPRVILTTAYREYALEGYDLDIVDYLLKPVTFERFFKAVERFLRSQPLPVVPAASGEGGTGVIFIKSGYKNIKVLLDDILYIESLKDYVKICTLNGAVTAKYKISDLEAELGAKGFLRIHRGFIVNLQRVTAFTASDVEIGMIELPIGESYKELVFAHLKKNP